MTQYLSKIFLRHELSDTLISKIQVAIAVLFCLLPVFFSYPFRINLFLAWEGAYRLSLGQIPFRDFTLPMGFGFWVLPAISFKIFGPKLFSLIYAQVFLNLLSCWSFFGIVKHLGLPIEKALVALLIFCLSYVFINFWPWYNHTVIVFEMVGLCFLFIHIFADIPKKKIIFLFLAVLFIALSFFTKQDGGGFAVLIATGLLITDSILIKNIKWLLLYLMLIAFLSLVFILPFVQYDLGYWFNYGQSPHSARLNVGDLLKDVFEHSEWIKFYLVVCILIVVQKFRQTNTLFKSKADLLFTMLTFGILIQALVLQVTSYIPHNANIYFHSFAIAYILKNINFNFSLKKPGYLILTCILVLFWWSADYWKYSNRILTKMMPGLYGQARDPNQLSKYSWSLENDTLPTKRANWKLSDLKSFDRIYLPPETIEGIKRIKTLNVVNHAERVDLKVLNMSELTPLAYELGFTPMSGQPLWFHKNVSIFDREIKQICTRIEEHYYDIVLFQTIPNLNNFFPDAIRDCLLKNYRLEDRFLAPRIKENSYVEVYLSQGKKESLDFKED